MAEYTVDVTVNMGMGPFAVESRLQKQQMIGLTKEQALEKHLDYVHYDVDCRLMRDLPGRHGQTLILRLWHRSSCQRRRDDGFVS